MKIKIIIFLFVQIIFWISCSDYTRKVQPGINEIVSEFEDPPGLARPGAWWMWLNGNITEEGIPRDLEAMKSKGMNRRDNNFLFGNKGKTL